MHRSFKIQLPKYKSHLWKSSMKICLDQYLSDAPLLSLWHVLWFRWSKLKSPRAIFNSPAVNIGTMPFYLQLKWIFLGVNTFIIFVKVWMVWLIYIYIPIVTRRSQLEHRINVPQNLWTYPTFFVICLKSLFEFEYFWCPRILRTIRCKNMCTIKNIEFIVMIIETNPYPWNTVTQPLCAMYLGLNGSQNNLSGYYSAWK